MVIFVFLLWGLLFLIYTTYCFRFLYREPIDRPLLFPEVRTVLSLLYITVSVALVACLITYGKIMYALVIIVVAGLTNFCLRKITRNRVIREKALFLQREANIPWNDAVEIAKGMIGAGIKDGSLI